MIQVTRVGQAFAVLCDGVECGLHLTRGAAIRAALTLREQQDPIKLNQRNI